MSSLKERWKIFGVVLLDPLIIFFFISTVFLSVVLVNQNNLIVTTVLTLIVSLSSGTLGGLISKRWDDLAEEKVIVTRAKSAHRGLELLLNSIIAVERRTRLYARRHSDEKMEGRITAEVIKTYFEETVERCLDLEEKVVSSIEDWTDILPNMEFKTALKEMRTLNSSRNDAILELEEINKALQEKENKSTEEIEKLVKEKKELGNQIAQIQKELTEKSLRVGVPLIGTSIISGSTDLYSTPMFLNNTGYISPLTNQSLITVPTISTAPVVTLNQSKDQGKSKE